ncbi:MAG: hypothetical protein Roseis2KO_09500 [Roseivirga sp.]
MTIRIDLKRLIRLILISVIAFPTLLSAQVKVIFDTDFGGDADDLGALAMLHHFIDKQECELLAIMSWQLEENAVAGLDAVNRYYQHPDTPIASRKGSMHFTDWNHSKPIADHFGSTLTTQDVPDATNLYRSVLANAADKEVVIITVGPLKNIQDLLESKPDSISELSGSELVHQKVKEFVIMGGQFPTGESEWNFNGNMPGVTEYVLDKIKVPVTFSGYEIGLGIKTGEIFNSIDQNSPLYIGYKHFSKNASWINQNYKGKILDNATYDQTAVLYAIRGGIGTLWDRVEGGYCQPDKTGGNQWIAGSKSHHSYLRLKASNEEMAELIENLMLGRF